MSTNFCFGKGLIYWLFGLDLQKLDFFVVKSGFLPMPSFPETSSQTPHMLFRVYSVQLVRGQL